MLSNIKNTDSGVKVACAVITYNPDSKIIDNINGYLDKCKLLIIVDNSDPEFPFPDNNFESVGSVIFLRNNENLGIASATNIAAKIASDKGFNYLITLDQDSRVPDDFYEKYLSSIQELDCIENVALVSPFHFYPGYTESIDASVKEITHCIASGMCLNLKIFRQLGGMDKGFFIDYVDFDYSLKARKAGFRLVRDGKIVIIHSLGNLQSRSLLGRKFTITNHSPLRLYYRTRNRFRVYVRYFAFSPFFVIKDLTIFHAELFKIIAYESLKMLKIRMILLGFWHFVTGKTGKY